MNKAFDLAEAIELDNSDPLKEFRDNFYFPHHEGQPYLYFCGNSLGLQPKNTEKYVLAELEDWQKFGVEGHFHGRHPWVAYHHFLHPIYSELLGALPDEVVMMNTLTVNLHLMMATFYRPTPTRYKILIEGNAFPSDQYAVDSQAVLHGFNPDEAIIELKPREGELLLRTSDILETIHRLGDSLALVMMGGVNYYTGQYYDLPSITTAAHAVGAYCGFDLAHTAGNIPLNLHEWKVDFAVWCTYKYLNSGPGGVGGCFVHEQHGNNTGLPRMAGWWGHDEENRFKMERKFVAEKGAQGWQISNAQILPMAAHWASLEIFSQAGMHNLRAKSVALTGYLEACITEINTKLGAQELILITPENPSERGCQLSICAPNAGKKLHQYLSSHRVITDWREPDVIRVAPVPLYNCFEDIYLLSMHIMGYFSKHLSQP